METPRPPEQAPRGGDTPAAGPRWRPRARYLAVALVLAVVGVGLLSYLLTASDTDLAADRAAAPAPLPEASIARTAPAPARPPTPPQPRPQPATEGDADPTRDLSSVVARGEKPSMAEVIARLHQRGVHTGLGAFSPPGTRPPLVGLAVPEDFVLPKGYVRHHQATDDGQRIEAVLMFAPDFQLFDAARQAIDMPKDRIVPPDLAPPGLPIRRIVIPAPLEAAGALP